MSLKKPIDLFREGSISYNEFSAIAFDIEDSAAAYSLGLSDEEFELYKKTEGKALYDIIAARIKKEEIIKKAKDFFRTEIAESHIQNTKKLRKLSEFNMNPFLNSYKANFLTGNGSSRSVAKALLYPRILGTSINTTFGNKLQKFCSVILDGFSSTTSGIDIEFIDLTDGRRKYCQIKAGPNTINKDDVKTINDHFQSIKSLARTNNLSLELNDLIVGVFYGEPEELSNHYKSINKNYPVYIGKEFWYRLTGDEEFYLNLINAIGEVASEFDSSALIESIISDLTKEIDNL